MSETNNTGRGKNGNIIGRIAGQRYVLSPRESFDLMNFLSNQRDFMENNAMTLPQIADLCKKQFPDYPIGHNNVKERMIALGIKIMSDMAVKNRRAKNGDTDESRGRIRVKTEVIEIVKATCETARKDAEAAVTLANEIAQQMQQFREFVTGSIDALKNTIDSYANDVNAARDEIREILRGIAESDSAIPPATLDAIGAVDKTVAAMKSNLADTNFAVVAMGRRCKQMDTELGKCMHKLGIKPTDVINL